ncbi:MAG: hypothetical protein IJM21_07530 [Clostridia bacterium]|nr:hypothetical protein [Clostridia bacterium]
MERMLAEHLISYFHYAEKPLNLIVDGAYEALAASIASVHGNVVIANLSSQSQGNVANVLCLRENAVVLLLAEPETYLRYRLPEYLDFSLGEPRICHMKSKSRVLIFPRDSLERMLSVPPREDADRKRRILTELHDDTTYRITTALGTDLCFKARKWLTLDFEICTAPVENSISGIIVVDGAVFYRRIKEKLIFEIKNGILQTVRPASEQGKAIAVEYLGMTADVMQDPVNKQLAEIGIGFCGGAQITDCFMEAETVAGTCHFCFGNNICYGGVNKSEFHGASVLVQDPVFTPVQM